MSRGYRFHKINELTSQTISDRRNMTYNYYMNQPMSVFEGVINMNITRNPQLINSLDRKKNQPLIKRYCYIPFNN